MSTEFNLKHFITLYLQIINARGRELDFDRGPFRPFVHLWQEQIWAEGEVRVLMCRGVRDVRDWKDFDGRSEPDRDVQGKVLGGGGCRDAKAQRLTGLDFGWVIVYAELVEDENRVSHCCFIK